MARQAELQSSTTVGEDRAVTATEAETAAAGTVEETAAAAAVVAAAMGTTTMAAIDLALPQRVTA